MFSGNVGSLMTLIEALDNPAARLIVGSTARQSGDPSARLEG